MRILYFYIMSDAPDRVRTVAPRHAAYWRDLGPGHYLGGPFADRSGGLITFGAGSLSEAEQLVADGPFIQEDLLEQRWVKEYEHCSTLAALGGEDAEFFTIADRRFLAVASIPTGAGPCDYEAGSRIYEWHAGNSCPVRP